MIIIVAMCNFQLRAANKGLKMKKIILTTSLIFSSAIVAHDLPNTFEAGQPIVASEVNENFAELKSEITDIKNQLENKNTDALPQYVGNSSSVSSGGAGIRFLTGLCDSTYSGSRICSTEEYIKTKTFPSEIQNGNAWITTGTVIPEGETYVIEGFTGVRAKYSINCSGYSSSSTARLGITVSETGRFSSSWCHEEGTVACCK